MKKAIYEIVHKRKVEFLQGEWVCDSKEIGYFTSKAVVKKVLKTYRLITGFCDYPTDFVVTKHMIDFHRRKRRDYIYVLDHFYEDDDGYDIVTEPWLFSTLKEAKEQMEKLKNKIPFCYHPNDFLISKCRLNKCQWTEGFTIDGKQDVKKKMDN